MILYIVRDTHLRNTHICKCMDKKKHMKNRLKYKQLQTIIIEHISNYLVVRREQIV